MITCLATEAPKGTKLEFNAAGKLTGTSVVSAKKGTTVTVEDLFKTLPVRRKELERKISTQWANVTKSLEQYACVQTNVKLTVTHQSSSGKRMPTMISTKGNATTKDNLLNVFGAKVLTALIPLDLTLELEATSGPSQRWSTQDDGGTKEIRVVGHISRPGSAEGQIPHKMMIYVNSRPCIIHPVNVAFKEAYSGTQPLKPFIFANILLKEHLYDVNVSPDKKTILLHDQTRVLEKLKEALTELFDSQNHTVPMSRLPGQKQTSYKQLTISRESTARAQTPRTLQTPARSQSGDGSEDDSRPKERRQSVDIEDSRNPSRSTSRSTARMSRDSVARDQDAVSLISNWVSRKSDSRVEPVVRPPKPGSEVPEGLSKEKRLLVEKLRNEGENAQEEYDALGNPDSSISTTQSSNATSLGRQMEARRLESVERESNRETSQPPIPSIGSPSKLQPSLSSAPSSFRGPRGSPAIATITIGNDHVVTSLIGGPYAKKSRIESDSVSSRTELSETIVKPLPSFGSRLSQKFAAPGATQISAPADEVDIDSEIRINSQSLSDEEDRDQSEEVDEDDEMALTEEVENTHDAQVDAAASAEATDGGKLLTVFKEEDADSSLLNPDYNDEDSVYIDEDEKKTREDTKVQQMIEAAENTEPLEANIKRAQKLHTAVLLKSWSTVEIVKVLDTSIEKIQVHMASLDKSLASYTKIAARMAEEIALDSDQAEEKLSLTIAKTDFEKMKIIGQFNLGFILASRSPNLDADSTAPQGGDEVFIIDQHASDEKYNFEKLQERTIMQSQQSVRPKTLDLSALDEEVVMENLDIMKANGFVIKVDQSGETPVGQRCQLVSLPYSQSTTFTPADLEELIGLILENPSAKLPRPSKVRKMFAMRACRTSIMIGRTLTHRQMGKIVKHLGELDKPWNCPHGRPTMRHLCRFPRPRSI